MNKNKYLAIAFFLLGILLFLDGFILILYKKIHLGTILPLIIGLIFCITVCYNQKIQYFLDKHTRFKKLWRMGWMLFLIWSMSLLTFFAYIHFKIQQNENIPKLQAIIVLGSGISQGQPSPTLAKRLERAGELAIQQPQALVLVTGGLDYGEVKTEADVMAYYLENQLGIKPNRILEESQSTSTDLNLKNSIPILNAHHLGLDSSIAIVTSDFHTLRAAAIAKKQGYRQFITVAAETPITTRYNAWLREYFAYISGWILGEY